VQIHPKEYESLDLDTIRETRQKRYGNTLLVFFEVVGADSRSGECQDSARETQDP
jgi:16S rRNA (guanine966-N2)-methyltransferase